MYIHLKKNQNIKNFRGFTMPMTIKCVITVLWKRSMIVSKQLSQTLPHALAKQTISPAPNSRHWLSHCCYVRLVEILRQSAVFCLCFSLQINTSKTTKNPHLYYFEHTFFNLQWKSKVTKSVWLPAFFKIFPFKTCFQRMHIQCNYIFLYSTGLF